MPSGAIYCLDSWCHQASVSLCFTFMYFALLCTFDGLESEREMVILVLELTLQLHAIQRKNGSLFL